VEQQAKSQLKGISILPPGARLSRAASDDFNERFELFVPALDLQSAARVYTMRSVAASWSSGTKKFTAH